MLDASFLADFYRLLESRKSIRKFKSTPVPRELIERVLTAGIHAASGKNRQNWRFFIVTGTKRDDYLKLSQKSWLKLKDYLSKHLKPSLYSFTERFFYTLGEAPVILFCYSLNDSEERYQTSIGSVYMAIQNIELAALAEGLGSCTLGAVLEVKDSVDEFLGISDIELPAKANLELLCAVVLGWPDHEPPKAPRLTESRFTWIS